MCSVYSGKCDLYSWISGLGGYYDKNGNPVSFNDPNVHCYFSDEYRDFLEFKKQTDGVIHQHKKIKVDEFNQDLVAKHCSQFEIIEHKGQAPDKRMKNGVREETTYTYKYWNKEYTLKELNKHGVFITIDIHFDTILDLIPYYPYLVVCGSHGDGKSYIVISNEPFPIEERDDHYRCGHDSKMWERYNKVLQDHYREIVLRYFNPEGREHIEELTFDENRQAKVSKPIDFNFDVEWYFDGESKSHWCSPKVADYENGIIEMSISDYGTDKYEGFLGHTMKVKYVEAKEHDIYLG